MVAETRLLLELWHEGLTPAALHQAALEAGVFPNMSARRLRNFVSECFAPRLLRDGGSTARHLKLLLPTLTSREFEQLLFLYACRANAVLPNFVREVYWEAYASGRETVSNADARVFVERANQDGKTVKPWTPSTQARVANGVTGCCGDFRLLARGSRRERRILPFRMEPRVTAFLAYELHFAGSGDNQIVGDRAWSWFGLDRADVVAELKRLSPRWSRARCNNDSKPSSKNCAIRRTRSCSSPIWKRCIPTCGSGPSRASSTARFRFRPCSSTPANAPARRG